MNPTKKIAILLYRYFPYGGLQKDFLEVAKELKSREIQFNVFTRKWEGAVPEGFPIKEVGERGLTNFSKNKNFVKDSSIALEEYDPDLVFGFNKMPGLDLYFAADTCFKKEALNKNPLMKFTRRFKQSIEYEKEVFKSSSSTEIFLLNNKQAKDFKSVYQIDPHQITIIPPGIDLNWSDHEQIEIHNAFKIPSEDKVALFVGSVLKEVNEFYEKFILHSPENFLWTHRRFKSRPLGEKSIYPEWKSRDKRRNKKRQSRE